jgi:thiosulfate dehydrogenase
MVHRGLRCALLRAAILFCCGLQPAFAQEAPSSSGPTPSSTAWDIPDIDALPDDEASRLIREGDELVKATYAHMGPEVADPARRYAGNNLACRNCHLDEGLKKFGLPLWGLTSLYPQQDAQSGGVITLQDRVNACMTRSMNGRALPVDSPEMKALAAYLGFLSTGVRPGQILAGLGAGEMPELARAADPGRGSVVYQEQCSRCHGVNGEGIRRTFAPTDLGYVMPPLWGPDSFDEGAGMNRLITAANFIHANMPNGTSYDFPRLSVEDSWDVAAFMVSKPHPRRPDLDRDYPDRLQKPVDAPYGPYADGFSQEQHIYGPFGPIREELKRLKQAAKSK